MQTLTKHQHHDRTATTHLHQDKYVARLDTGELKKFTEHDLAKSYCEDYVHSRRDQDLNIVVIDEQIQLKPRGGLM